jgi:hypothetical protein
LTVVTFVNAYAVKMTTVIHTSAGELGNPHINWRVQMEKFDAVLVYHTGRVSAGFERITLGLFETYAGGMRYAYDNFGPIISGKVAWVLFSDGTSRQAGIQLTTEYIQAHGI